MCLVFLGPIISTIHAALLTFAKAMALKSSGSYVSRGLGYRGCDFEVVKCSISPKQRQVGFYTLFTLGTLHISLFVISQEYNRLSDFWQELKQRIDAADTRWIRKQQRCPKTNKIKRDVMKSQFWSCNQR